jgi:hypothetical protein
MITSIECTTPLGDTVTLALDASISPYVVKNIDGLGPVAANIARADYVTKDGSIFQNARAGERNIVLTLSMNPDYSTTTDPYGELRRALYPVLYPQSEVKLVIESTELETLEITGWVESFEPTIFTKDPDIRISIICPDPFFSSQVNTVGSRVGPGSFVVNNPGNVETGFTVLIDYFTTASIPLEFKRVTPLPKSMYYRGGMYAQGSPVSLYFNTRQGQKSAKFGWPVSTEPPSYFDPFAPFNGTEVIGFIENWLTVLPGENTFQLVNSDIIYSPHVTLFFKARYLGF